METYRSICFKHRHRLPVPLLVSQTTSACEKGPSSSTLLWDVFQTFSKIKNCLLYNILLYDQGEPFFQKCSLLKDMFSMALQFNFFLKCTKNFCYQTASILFSYTYRTLNTKFYSLSCIQDFNPFLLWKTRTKKYIFLNEEWKSEFSHTVVCQGPPLTEVGDVRGVKLKFSVKMAIKAHN